MVGEPTWLGTRYGVRNVESMLVGRPAESDKSEGTRRRILIALVGCHTINDFYGVIVPIMLPAIRASFGLSYSAVAIVPFLTLATSAVLQPTLGYLADRRALRRALMAIGFVAVAIAMLGLGQSGSYVAVLAAAICLGIGASTYHPQSATLLRYFFDQKNRGLAQGVHGIGNAAGFALAPLVMAYLLRQTDWNHAATIVAFPALVGAVIAVVVLREPVTRGSPGLLAGVTRPLLLLTVVNGLALAASSGFTTWLPSYYVLHGFNLSNAALLTAAMSAAAFVAQPLGGTISDRIGRRNLIVVALTGAAISLGCFLIAPSIVWAIGLSIVISFWMSLMPPVMMVYASELASGERTGTAVGVVWGLATTISAVSLPITGKIIDLAGGQIAPAYAMIAMIAIVAAVVALRLPQRRSA
jgi:FSR family fosmidomycin resistance protein-like MFS transporter